MRVHELAKELTLSSKDLLDKLHALGMDVKNHMSTLTPEQVQQVRSGAPAAPAAAPVPAATEKAPKPAAPPPPPPEPPAPVVEKKVILHGPIIVKELAEQLGVKPNQLIAELMTMNVFASINEKVDPRVVQQVAHKHGYTVEHEKKQPERPPPPPKPEEEKPAPVTDREQDKMPRPPIVTFMGHVDHGKTSLLDHIRRTRVAQGEDGGITQHIGAYMVTYNDHTITFLDTPGHEAFTAMRARGATLTDIAVIVIAADDGIMPQTREAIQHAKAANVCMMIAINKVDLRTANVDRVKRQLQQEGLTPEDWGGDLVCCPVSAATGEGIDHLLEMILLQAEMLELKANPRRRGQGFVIEARLEAGMGPTANLLVRAGTLQVGDAIVCGPCWGRVKALINDVGVKVRTAGPSFAVKCLGLNSVPEPGTEFEVYPNDKAARAVATERMEKRRLEAISTPRRASLEDLLKPQSGPAVQELVVVLKADVQGSLEAIQQALRDIKSEKVTLKIALAGVGSINENDVLLASASNAIIIGFHVSKESGATAAAKREGVEVRLYSVIYELLDDIRDAMAGLLEPMLKQNVIGHAQIRQVFELSKKGRVAGCMVTDGRVTSRSRARVVRDGEVVYEGALASLKRFQNDASEVREGQECGIRLDNFPDFAAGDVIELYEVEKIEQSL
ncbi:MAG: Translation initiation factor IF-2 [Verrucomicrobia bacterium ADurb.Bin345]|nr:MAG: Translation initiation factor IF-2 [Verrucomicrobia bacterium ADurb.Bin345]